MTDESTTKDGNLKGEGVMIDVASMDLKHKAVVKSGGIDLKQLEKAETVIANMSSSYHDWAMEDMNKLQSAYILLAKEPANYDTHLKAIFEIAHDMKGQGGSFNFQLVTEIGNYLCRFIERIQSQPTQKILEVVKLHIDAIQIILTAKIKGDGGAKGQRILNGLEATLQKYTPDLVENMHQLKEAQQAAEDAKPAEEKENHS